LAASYLFESLLAVVSCDPLLDQSSWWHRERVRWGLFFGRFLSWTLQSPSEKRSDPSSYAVVRAYLIFPPLFRTCRHA